MGNLEDQFKRTILAFKNRLEPKELVEIQCNSLSELNEVISQVQRRQRDQKSMMNLNRIKSFLEAMDQFEQTIKVFVNVNDIVAFIWGPIKLLLSVANTWADAFDELLDAYEQIGEHMPLLQQYVSLFKANPHMQAVLALIFDDITAYHNEAVRFFAKSVFKQVWRSFWKHHESRFRHLLDALVRHRKLIEEQATVVHFLQYQSDRERAQAEFKKAEEDRIRSMQVDVMRWLCSDDNKANYEAHCAVRQHNPESGTWVLGDSKVKRWKTELEPVKPLLWLTGIPGAGKSVLASVIIEDCLQSTGADQKPLYATSYFFCSRDNAQTTTCMAVLRGLIAQLLSKSPDHLFYCHEKFLQDREIMLTSMQRGKQLFDFFCDSMPRVCVVVDGLDECEKPERRALLEYLNVLVEKLHSAHPGKLRVLIASQQDGDIRKLLSSAEVLTLSVELNGEDIRAYVDYRLSGTAQHYGLPDAVIEDVANTTCAKASDMFLFARLVLDNLKDQPDQESFLAEIDKDVFPKDLSEAYARILKNIKTRTKGSDTKWSAAVKLLGWMANARRPMRWHEIQAASSIDGKSSSLQYDAKKLRVHAQDLCGALILELPGQRLTLVHSTARTHIVRNEFINPFQVECNLTTLCLQYLAFPAFHSKTDDDTLMSLIREGQLAFHEYAIANFFIHLLELAKTGAEALTNQSHAPGSPQQSLREKHSKDFDDFEHAFEEFTETHSLSDQKAPEEEMTKADHECRAFADWGFYSNLQKLWAISRQHANAALDVRNKPCLESIETTFTRGRDLIEKLSNASDSPSKILDQYYGGTRFKCNKVTCHWFNVGFANAKTRDDHVARHERPFRCEVTDCSAEDIGFKTSKQLEKHVRMFHPTLEEKGESFKPLKAPPPKTPYACHLCDKRFTRKFHLTSHIHNHNQEKPFACGQCGREFTRANDCRRHEKTIHSKRG